MYSREDLLSTVDAIKSLLADTYRHLNARAPPNKLPQELLVMVFQQVLPTHTAISFPAIEHDGYRPILHALKVITQVCRLWRDVAFGTLALWTRIDARGYPGDEVWSLMQRSDPLPLSVFLDVVDGGTMPHYCTLLRSSSSRLHRVDIDMTRPTPSVIEKLLAFDAPTLRCLTISSPAFNCQPSLNRDGVTHIIPILQGQADSLEALAIVPSIGWIPANHFPSLTHLYISFDISAASPNPHYILLFLHHTPRLENLHLHRLEDRESPPTNEFAHRGLLPVELSRLRSLVFTVSSYHSVADILHGLSLPPHTLVRLDGLFVSYDSPYPRRIPANLGPLSHVTTMELAVQTEMLFLVVEGASSGLWLRVCHEENVFWDSWLSGLHLTLPLENLASLRIDVYMDDEASVLALLPHMVLLSELFVRFNGSWACGAHGDGATSLPLVRALCSALSQSQLGTTSIACPSLRALTLEWPRNMPNSGNLGVPNIIAMLSARSRLGHPIRRVVVQAITVQFGSVRPSHFSEQLSPLAAHVEEYEECVDAETHVCSFEMRDMWNIEGAEDYWVVDEKLRPQYRPLWSHDYSFS